VLYGFGQTKTKVGLLPRLQVATKLSDKFTLTSMIETRHFVYNSKLADKNTVTFNLIDFSSFITYKLSDQISFNLAYTLRVIPGLISHRAIQQLLVLNKFKRFSLQQRLGFDQTFNAEDFPIFRARYRVSFLIPLKGPTLESKEFYLNLAQEYIGGIQNKQFDLEARIIPKIGYVLNKNNTFEFGLDYRVHNFLEKKTQHVYWTNFTWYARINPKDKIEKRE
jgi:long-subunit fatty acid transport protein